MWERQTAHNGSCSDLLLFHVFSLKEYIKPLEKLSRVRSDRTKCGWLPTEGWGAVTFNLNSLAATVQDGGGESALGRRKEIINGSWPVILRGGANPSRKPLFSRQARPPFMVLCGCVCSYDHLDFPQSRLNTWPVLDSGCGKSQASRPLYIYWYPNTHSVTHPRFACFVMSKELMNECFCNIKHSLVCLGKSQKSFAWSHFKYSWRCNKDSQWKWSSARNVSKAAA